MAKNITVSIIVPALNEESTIDIVLNKLQTLKYVQEIIVVDDGSSDRTANIVKKHLSKNLKLISHPQNMGKGAAIQSALKMVSGQYTFIQDADLEYDPQEIEKLIEVVQNHSAQAVYGSRFTGTRKNMFYWHMLGNKFLSFLVNILYNTTLSDMETCYKLIDTKLLKSLDVKEKRFGIEPEITCKLLKSGIFIYETPISYSGRTFAEGKKISWKDGIQAVYVIIKLKLF